MGLQCGFGADPTLYVAVDACIHESPTGDCKCENGCGKYNGPISEWDVSNVTNMKYLFYTKGSSSCSIYCNFNGDIQKWDTSRVTTMHKM